MVFVSAQPDDVIFSWQTELFIENIRGLGYTSQIQVLIFSPAGRPAKSPDNRFHLLQNRYKDDNVLFFWYPDISNLVTYGIAQSQYPPLLRPHILKRHFANYPELKDKAIFYHDSDILFTRYIDFSPLLGDDICYLSNARSYLGVDYFDGKSSKVLSHMQANYEGVDVLDECCRLIGINRAICTKNESGCGGAQYLLKNIDSDFWEDVEIGAYRLRRFLSHDLGGINKTYFSSEDDGFQSWCADMWSLLWNLWKRNVHTVTPNVLDFCWATDKIDKWDDAGFYHDAGVNKNNEAFLFNKRRPEYIYGNNLPYNSDLSYVSPDYCSSRYVLHINDVKKKYNY